MGQFMLLGGIFLCLAVAFAISALWQKSRGLAIALALALPLAAGGLYWLKGTPAALDAANRTPPKNITEATAQLERLTRADPKNYADMAMLARAYMATQDYAKARDAYARAHALQPGDATIYVEYAESMLRTSPDRRFPPEAVSLLESAIQKDPNDQRALFFYGLHQRQSGDAAGAVATWEKLLAQLDPATSKELRTQINAARHDAGMPELAAPAVVKIRVNLDPTLAREVHRGAALFVFARKGQGEGPPVAVTRLVPDRFPVDVELSDSDSPMTTTKLFSQKQVVLMARLSQSGQALPASGDVESDPIVLDVAPDASAELTLSRSVP
jgi:cytochrome c-type biogenesis protein CcmH